MGVCVYPVLEREIEGVDYLTDGKMLAKILDDATDRRAAEIGIEPLMNFFGFDPEMLFEEFDVPESKEIKERWFSADKGLKAVEGLIEDLTKNPQIYSADTKNSNGAIDDLKELQKVLDAASRNRLKWYLAIYF